MAADSDRPDPPHDGPPAVEVDEEAGRETLHVETPPGRLRPTPRGSGGPGLRRSSPEVRADEQAPSEYLGEYRLIAALGEGGMGKVFLAEDPKLERNVAVKMCLTDTEQQQARFLAEARVLGQLTHPNIVAVHDLGVSDTGRPYYTMPVVRGQTLETILEGLKQGQRAASRVYSLTRLIQVLLQVLQAVQYAHLKGVVHRDLKPANVMLGEHGQVLVLDWGLAKIVGQEDAVEPLNLTAFGQTVGTPQYMAPEQVQSGEVDARTDVYALGAILYECLTLQVPFEGKLFEVLTAQVLKLPVPPHVRAPERQIPLPLEHACLKALSKAPADRHPSVAELHEEIQNWLETETDRTRRREVATEFADAGQQKLRAHRALKETIAGLEREAADLRASLRPWQPLEDKAALYQLEDRVAQHRAKLGAMASAVVTTLAAAIGHDDSHPGARRAMADYYWMEFCDAEASHDLLKRDYYAKLVAAFDDNRYARQLAGHGSLAIRSQPAGADVWLYEFEEEQLRLLPQQGRLVGVTPVEPIELPMGSYLAVLGKEGYPDTRYPVWISRHRAWDADVRLYTREQIGDGFVHVPGGPFILGGDPALYGWCLPASEPVLDDFFIARDPVTMEEYLEFLNDPGMDSARVLRQGPRSDMGATSYVIRNDQGRYELPPTDPFGNALHPRRPVVGISWHDAVAYCAWRAARDGVAYRLPTELEWEKAARGVDGRWFPWGTRYDATLCNSGETHHGRPVPLPVDSFPTDVSVYGVRGMAGNARDWTGTLVVQGEGDAAIESSVIRGGAAELAGATDFTTMSRCAFRYVIPTMYLNPAISFRLAHSPAAR